MVCMRKILLLCSSILIFASCENTWDNDAQDLFRQGCLNAAKKDNMPEDKAKAMCDCRLEKAMEKHPNFAEAMDNIQDIVNDPAMKDCTPE